MPDIFNTPPDIEPTSPTTPQPEAKPWWASKTIWINAVALIAAVSAGLGLDLGLDGEGQAALVGGIMAVVNMVLRVVTGKPIANRVR